LPEPSLSDYKKNQILFSLFILPKKPKVLKKARISKPGSKKAKLATLQYCEQYIGNIVLL